MLCMQTCIDRCDMSSEEAAAIRECTPLPDLLAIQAECPLRLEGGGDAARPEGCEMLDIRDRLQESVWAAENSDDLGKVLSSWSDYELEDEARRPET